MIIFAVKRVTYGQYKTANQRTNNQRPGTGRYTTGKYY
jgi:hypothetical protein